MTQELSDEGLKAKAKELLNQIDAIERLGPAEYIYMDKMIYLALKQVRRETREADAVIAESTKITEEQICLHEDGRRIFAHDTKHLSWDEIATAHRALEGR